MIQELQHLCAGQDKKRDQHLVDYGDIFKVIVGNNRMVIAKELGIDKIPSIIVNHKADTFNIEGEVLNTEDKIKKYFHLPDKVKIRKNEEGIIDLVMPQYYMEVKHLYV